MHKWLPQNSQLPQIVYILISGKLWMKWIYFSNKDKEMVRYFRVKFLASFYFRTVPFSTLSQLEGSLDVRGKRQTWRKLTTESRWEQVRQSGSYLVRNDLKGVELRAVGNRTYEWDIGKPSCTYCTNQDYWWNTWMCPSSPMIVLYRELY